MHARQDKVRQAGNKKLRKQESDREHAVRGAWVAVVTGTGLAGWARLQGSVDGAASAWPSDDQPDRALLKRQVSAAAQHVTVIHPPTAAPAWTPC
jgi:hypothetical protein